MLNFISGKELLVGSLVLIKVKVRGLAKLSYLGKKSQLCCIRDPMANHKQFAREKIFSIFSPSGVCVGCHSYGVNLSDKYI